MFASYGQRYGKAGHPTNVANQICEPSYSRHVRAIPWPSAQCTSLLDPVAYLCYQLANSHE